MEGHTELFHVTRIVDWPKLERVIREPQNPRLRPLQSGFFVSAICQSMSLLVGGSSDFQVMGFLSLLRVRLYAGMVPHGKETLREGAARERGRVPTEKRFHVARRRHPA